MKVYKALQYSILKLGPIPIEFQEEAIFHTATDLLEVELNLDFSRFEQLIDDEWILLEDLKKRRTL